MQPPNQKSIGELQEIVASAALDPVQWHSFARRFRELVPEIKIFMHVTDKTTEQLQPALAEGIGDDFLASYVDHFDSINPWTKFTIVSPFMKPIWSEDNFPASGLRNTEFYDDFLKPLGESDAATFIKLIGDDTRFAQLSLHYDSRNAEATNNIVNPILHALAPTLRRSLEALRLQQARAEGKYYRGFLDTLLHPSLVIDGSGRVKAVNEAAEALLAEIDTVRIGHFDELSFSDRIVARAVESASALLQTRQRPGQTSPLSAPILTTPAGRFRVTLLPLSSGISAFWGVAEYWSSGAALLISLSPIISDEAQFVSDIRRTLGLTMAEASLALLLAQGSSLPNAANHQTVSYETARSQLKSIFAKLGISRQTELVALLHRLLPGLL